MYTIVIMEHLYTPLINIGTKIVLWNVEDEQWYQGRITEIEKRDENGTVFCHIEYTDGTFDNKIALKNDEYLYNWMLTERQHTEVEDSAYENSAQDDSDEDYKPSDTETETVTDESYEESIVETYTESINFKVLHEIKKINQYVLAILLLNVVTMSQPLWSSIQTKVDTEFLVQYIRDASYWLFNKVNSTKLLQP